ncbi:hypothetical protein MMAD_37700 [Mycolicibacterium madagascariense]|uniref:Uncharacterized protein n=1 Tax=Mycolicibacterium madagascariense TaxID=212765 RepID=A0A7I7XK09_9MYCO|nr:hypothetical protein MMAD_37700 [Mycolicibacterium madagascariense]
MTPRPLVKRAPDGRRYVVPGTPPRIPPPGTSASASGAPSGPKPSPGRHGGARAQLTDDDVREIRADYAAGRWTKADLAYIHGVSVGVINNVVVGRSYTHVKPKPEEQES